MITNWSRSANRRNLTVYRRGMHLLAPEEKRQHKLAESQFSFAVYIKLHTSKMKNHLIRGSLGADIRSVAQSERTIENA